MPKSLLDSNILLEHFRRMPDKNAKGADDAKTWADLLIKNRGTNAIVSPVEIEVLAGTRDPHDLELTEAFLSRFEVVDGQRTLPEDWEMAKRFAKRVVKLDRQVPRQHRRRDRQDNPGTPARQLGDCLISAIARRLNYSLITADKRLIQQEGRTS